MEREDVLAEFADRGVQMNIRHLDDDRYVPGLRDPTPSERCGFRTLRRRGNARALRASAAVRAHRGLTETHSSVAVMHGSAE
jgi:hypothetical protein